MTVDLLYTGLLPHQGPLLYVQHAVFYAGYAVSHHAVVVESLRYQSCASSGMGA